MLSGISKILTGDLLKILCDMGHGDSIVIADAHFPGESLAKYTTYGKTVRLPGVSASELFDAVEPLFPLDVNYTEYPASVMALTESDREKGMPEPVVWKCFSETLHRQYPDAKLGEIERYEFYEKTKSAYAIVITGEERQYGNLILTKGCVLS